MHLRASERLAADICDVIGGTKHNNSPGTSCDYTAQANSQGTPCVSFNDVLS